MSRSVDCLLSEAHEVSGTLDALCMSPFKQIDLAIGNEEYEDYEHREVYTLQYLPALNRALRQWRQHIAANLFNTIFLPRVCFKLSDLVVQGLLSKQDASIAPKNAASRSKGISQLGALYFEKIVRQTKQFLLYQINTVKPSNE